MFGMISVLSFFSSLFFFPTSQITVCFRTVFHRVSILTKIGFLLIVSYFRNVCGVGMHQSEEGLKRLVKMDEVD